MVPDVDEESCEPSQVTLFTPTLSLATTENVTVCDCELVVNETLVSKALKIVKDGLSL